MRAFDLVREWPANNTSICIIDRRGDAHTFGDTARASRIASISKLITAWATLIAVEDGSTSFDAQVGQQECTLAHLLSHAGGYSFDGAVPIVTPGRKRIYSNTGYELIADHVEQVSEISFTDFLHEAIFEPLGMPKSFLKSNVGWPPRPAVPGWPQARAQKPG